MQFTHYTPGITLPPAAVTGTTVQIYSFKITRLHNDLKWPLYVYGEVAARDTVDRNRNLLFCRSEFRGQVLTENVIIVVDLVFSSLSSVFLKCFFPSSAKYSIQLK